MLISLDTSDYINNFYLCREILNPEEGTKSTSRDLGIVVGRGTAITVICPMDGTEEIANPFTQQQ